MPKSEAEKEIIARVEKAMNDLAKKYDSIKTWDELADEHENIAKVIRRASKQLKKLQNKKGK